MARSPVGYRSPFNKISSVKASPMKVWTPAHTQIAMAAAPGIINAVGSLFGRKKRRKEQAAARKELEAAKAEVELLKEGKKEPKKTCGCC